MTLLLGAIADDFTGATDLANTLVKGGMGTVQVIGVPDATTDVGDAEAVVVALKTRSAPVGQAVAESLASLNWLRDAGAQQFFFKYCSTFDSTAEGNIGPVADALLDALGEKLALVCPAFPVNKRSVYQGYLFVGDQLLSDSSMRNHPLTPMQDSSLLRLLAAQSSGQVGLVPYHTVAEGYFAVAAAFNALRDQDVRYAVVDALADQDLETIGRAAADHRLVTGGSGVAIGLPDNFRRRGHLSGASKTALPRVIGREVVFSGSCSEATRDQIEYVQGGWPAFKLDARRLASGKPVVEEAVTWALITPEAAPILIYSSAAPDDVAAIQNELGRERAGNLVEAAFAGIARRLVDEGFARLVVAGGETSGAIVSALNIRALRIGAEIDPGVPWTTTFGAPRVALALKSGNFGAPDFFDRAFKVLDR